MKKNNVFSCFILTLIAFCIIFTSCEQLVQDLSGSVSFNTVTPRVGETIFAHYQPGNGSGVETWEWYRVTNFGDIYISGGSNAYTPDHSDVGHRLKAVVSYSDQNGSINATTVNAVVAAEDPLRQDLSGEIYFSTETPTVGETLFAYYQLGNGSGVETWEWYRVTNFGDIYISGGSNAYTPDHSDVGHRLKAVVSYSDQNGSISATTIDNVFDPWQQDPVAINITFTQITNAAPDGITGPTIYIDDLNGTRKTIDTISLTEPEQYTSIRWYVNGEPVPGTQISQNGAELTISSAIYNQTKHYFITIEVIKDGMLYNQTITFVVEP